jgi:hypothetical protein
VSKRKPRQTHPRKPRPSPEYLAELRRRYRHSTKPERSTILDEFVKTSGYHRKHAITLLRGNYRHRAPGTPIRRPRASVYTAEDACALLRLVDLFDGINSKRLRAALDRTLDRLRSQRHLQVSMRCFEHLKTMSPATMDRLRRKAAQGQARPHGRALTKPGSLLKRQIPVRTFADWDDAQPGFVECDLVDHGGGDTSGDFAHTLTVTDVATGWTELYAVRNKAQTHVFTGLQTIRDRLPFPLRGLDSDNGSEFINNELWRYCEREHITFTRSRAGRKNDNCFVEQKNWSVVRRLVGYGRYDTARQVALLNRLYGYYRLYVNFFLPVMKLKEKVRDGSHTRRIYDDPQTPYERALASPHVSAQDKAKLRQTYATLDVVVLRRELDALLEQLHPTPWRQQQGEDGGQDDGGNALVDA